MTHRNAPSVNLRPTAICRPNTEHKRNFFKTHICDCEKAFDHKVDGRQQLLKKCELAQDLPFSLEFSQKGLLGSIAIL